MREDHRRMIDYAQGLADGGAALLRAAGNTGFARSEVERTVAFLMEGLAPTNRVDYFVVCNASNNPPEVVDRREAHLSIYLTAADQQYLVVSGSPAARLVRESLE